MSWLDDTWPIPFGKHKLKQLQELPADYLRLLANDNGLLAKYETLKRYLAEHLDHLEEYQAQKQAEVKAKMEASSQKPVCTKITYPTESEAKKHLRWIKNKSDGGHKKPYRAYECPFCSGWHLTKYWEAKKNSTTTQ